jgi:hypothetical protein
MTLHELLLQLKPISKMVCADFVPRSGSSPDAADRNVWIVA